MTENLHDGHRRRVREKFEQHGFDENTPEHEVLEMLLFYSIPRRDTNLIAHNLINHFGSLCGVLEAPKEELMEVGGISENSASLIKLMLPIAHIYSSKKCKCQRCFKSIEQIGDFLLNKYFAYTDEVFSVISVDASGKMLGYDVVERGDLASVGIPVRKLVEMVIKRKSPCIIIAHNHPSGIALPSEYDVKTTVEIMQAMNHIGVKLLDHFIMVDGDYVSMAQSRRFDDIFRPNTQ